MSREHSGLWNAGDSIGFWREPAPEGGNGGGDASGLVGRTWAWHDPAAQWAVPVGGWWEWVHPDPARS